MKSSIHGLMTKVHPGSTTLPIIKRVAHTIDRYAMFAPQDKVLVGVSGGPDSTALLQILHALAAHYRITLGVAHYDHGLRPETAEMEADHVAAMAHKLKRIFHAERGNLDPAAGSLEARARQERYAFYDRVCRSHEYSKIALGHQADDNAEAVLLHLLRGSGTRGIAGIPPVRDGRVVRPLIALRRSEILDYLHTLKVDYFLDASNDDQRFDRNRIRHQLIPLLESAFNPNVVAALNRTADLCWEEEQWLEHLLQGQVDELVASQSPTSLELRWPKLKSQPLGLQRRLIRDALRRWHGHLKSVEIKHIDAVIGLLPSHGQAKRISLPNQWQVERADRHLRFTRHRGQSVAPGTASPRYEYVVEKKGGWPRDIEIPEAGGCLHLHRQAVAESRCDDSGEHIERFDLDRLTFPLVIRNFQPGDRLLPFGMQGSQKLKKLFANRKIPKHLRTTIPLLVSGGRIIWVVGIRRSRIAAITAATARVLVAQWRPHC